MGYLGKGWLVSRAGVKVSNGRAGEDVLLIRK